MDLKKNKNLRGRQLIVSLAKQFICSDYSNLFVVQMQYFYNKFFSLSIFYQSVRIAPHSSPRAAPAYVGIVVLVGGGGGGGGVVVAPAVVVKIARPSPAFAIRRSDAAL
jgi:hypothetical protein